MKVKSFKSIFIIFLACLLLCLNVFTIKTTSANDEKSNSKPIKIVKTKGREYVDGEIIVKYKNNKSINSIEKSLNSLNSKITKTLSENIMLTEVPEGVTTEGFIEELKTKSDEFQHNYSDGVPRICSYQRR